MTLFSGLGTDVHFYRDETELQWEDYLFETAECRGVAKETTSDLRTVCSMTMEQDGYCKETSKNARTEQLVLKLSSACGDYFWPCKGARESRAQ